MQRAIRSTSIRVIAAFAACIALSACEEGQQTATIDDDCLAPLSVETDLVIHVQQGDSAVAKIAVATGCVFMRDGVTWTMQDPTIASVHVVDATTATVVAETVGQTSLRVTALREPTVQAVFQVVVVASMLTVQP
jgi:hypothetical protein